MKPKPKKYEGAIKLLKKWAKEPRNYDIKVVRKLRKEEPKKFSFWAWHERGCLELFDRRFYIDRCSIYQAEKGLYKHLGTKPGRVKITIERMEDK